MKTILRLDEIDETLPEIVSGKAVALVKMARSGFTVNDPEFTKGRLEPIEILGLDPFADSTVIVKARTKTKPIGQWAVGRELNRRLRKRCDAKDIEIPFPRLTPYVGQDKGGQAVPLTVAMKENTNTPI
ncbi:MAG: hypothetical protein ACYTAS_09755 [Planctomycetota bacterium]|jgi:small conductance mechanosensitive channel